MYLHHYICNIPCISLAMYCMKKKLFYLSGFLLLFFFGLSALGQDTLPKFSVRNIGNNHIIIGWVNNYPRIKQISIQRSFDSLHNYKTILSVPDPMAQQNGFADTKASSDHMFYRLFIMLDEGSFLFSAAKRPVLDTSAAAANAALPVRDISAATDSASGKIRQPVVKKPDYIPSFYVYTNKDGYVFINLPDAAQKKYHIKFYEDDDTFLFEIKSIKESALTLDKVNFYHSGWFKFELYNDDKLVEKNKFYIAKDF